MRSLIITFALVLGFGLQLYAQRCIAGDCQNGKGKMDYGNGAIYEGEFRDGKIAGKGMLQFRNGNRYIGNWSNQRPQGKGRMIYDNGNVYFGNFEQSKLHGIGRMEYANGDIYDGEWLEGNPHGKGTFQKANRDVYEGDFRDGKYDGYGVMTYVYGATYKGYWKNSKYHGEGTLTEADGDVLSEMWIEGKTAKEVYAYQSPTSSPTTTRNNTAAEPDFSTTRSVNNDVKVWAVVIGVGSYEHMPSLRFTDDDAYQLFAFLKSPEGGALPDNQVRVLIDENATYRNILATTKRVLMQADENDVALFYFSGHGLESSFLPVDYDGTHNIVYHNEIKELIDKSRAKHKVVIVDACHSGGYKGFRSSNIDKSLAHYYRTFEQTRGGTALLLSSKEKEYSLEDGGLRSGVFSYFIIKGLKGRADRNGDRIVNVQELFNYARQNVRQYTASMQTPLLMGSFDPKMPLAVVRY
ncbi:MAG: caspase family protein [Bacteroidota bacterium]